jgi:hypothetical protein
MVCKDTNLDNISWKLGRDFLTAQKGRIFYFGRRLAIGGSWKTPRPSKTALLSHFAAPPFCRPIAKPYSSEYVLGYGVQVALRPRQTDSKSSIFLGRGVLQPPHSSKNLWPLLC